MIRSRHEHPGAPTRYVDSVNGESSETGICAGFAQAGPCSCSTSRSARQRSSTGFRSSGQVRSPPSNPSRAVCITQ
eukprot:2315102-Prymnesium_polylepis.1